MMETLTEFNSPFTKEQSDILNKLVQSLDPGQWQWLSGFSAGIAVASASSVRNRSNLTPELKQDADFPMLTILYGTETGNSRSLAERTCQKALMLGIKAVVKNLADYRKRQLKAEKNLVIITSTHGDGEPPETSRDFFRYLHSPDAPVLDQLRYSVLALGDSSYDNFCKTGRDYDLRLEELGASQFFRRVDCDTDFEPDAETWMDGMLSSLTGNIKDLNTSSYKVSLPAGNLPAPDSGDSSYSRRNPYVGRVLQNINLNGRGAEKETRHVELLLEDPRMTYEPGDALGVVPVNSEQQVGQILNVMKFHADEPVTLDDTRIPLAKALMEILDITSLSQSFLHKYSDLAQNGSLIEMLAAENKDILHEYKSGRQIIDVLEDFPSTNPLSEQSFISTLRNLAPRLYSIASSFRVNPGEVHITVAAIRYHKYGRTREGVASTYISDRLEEGSEVKVFIQKNENFRLPDDPSTPIIMIGPGTGVAPFRAFIEERTYREASGKNWLFFGNRNFRTDFLYQREWQDYMNRGDLTRMDVAFSRDGAGKIYVQDRLWEKRREFYSWLEEGAYIYICGDAGHMAKDVHNSLVRIVQETGGISIQAAEEYIQKMQQEKRYLKDVY